LEELVRRVFKNYGRFNGKCVELTSLRDVAGLVHLEPFEETFEFREQTEKVIVRAAIGKDGGGISNEEILTAKQKLVLFLTAAAQNKKDSGDLQEAVQSQEKIIPFAETSPALFVDPKTILLRKP
jgi:hypothetical protein